MHKPILIPFIVFGFIIFTEDVFAEEVYKSVDEKGTINFSDNPNSPVITTKKAAAKQDGAEVLKKNERAKRPHVTDSDIKTILLKYPTWRGNEIGSGGGSSRAVRTGKS